MGTRSSRIDLPAADDSAGWGEYVDAVVDAVEGKPDLVLVAQSMGGFTAPLVCDQVPVDLLVMVAAMIPLPGETGGQWWDNTGQGSAMHDLAVKEGWTTDFDMETYFFHDVPDEVVREASRRDDADQSYRPFAEPWPRAGWPDVATRFVLPRDDRFLPSDWMRQVVRDRLAIEPDEIAGGHLVALSNPHGLAELLHNYVE